MDHIRNRILNLKKYLKVLVNLLVSGKALYDIKMIESDLLVFYYKN
jgi:hypothetical protein